MTNTMENVQNANEVETVEFIYQGIICQITKDEYEALRNGWVTPKEMFE